MKAVYLCGAIHGLADKDAKEWRDHAAAVLSGRFRVLNPLAVDYRGREAGNELRIVRTDLQLLADADVLLVNAERPGWGTAMEVLLAWQGHKPAVAFGAGPKLSPWLIAHTVHRCATLADAISLIMGTWGR